MSDDGDLESNEMPLLEEAAAQRKKPFKPDQVKPDKVKPNQDSEDVKKSKEADRSHERYMWDNCFKPFVWLVLTGAALGVFSAYCTSCLIGLCLVCLCLCPFIPIVNIPLWISIVILLWRGWSLTNGHLSLVWE